MKIIINQSSLLIINHQSIIINHHQSSIMSSLIINRKRAVVSASKRHIADVEILSQYNARPIYDVDSDDHDSIISNATSSNSSIRTDINATSTCSIADVDGSSSAETTATTSIAPFVTGVSISNWDIQTSSSTIANEHEMDTLTCTLEDLANEKSGVEMEGKDKGKGSEGLDDNRNIQRRLNIPEIVFVNAFVHLKLRRKQDVHDEEEFKVIDLMWNASDALKEWASCHSHLTNGLGGIISENCESINSYRGVSIIQSIDAKLWSERHKKQQQQQQRQHINTSSTGSSSYFHQNAISTSNEFNYDWTFSTPYNGTSTIIQNTNSRNLQKQPMEWIPSPSSKSMIDLSLLTDQSQPILYFDDINLYEDDMHDNGYVSLRCKIRVMPTCFFLLQTLFVRVDHVLVRVKEVRTFCKFETISNCDREEESPPSSSSSHRICRDISWRECKWDELSKHNLPTFVSSWRIEDENAGPSNQHRVQGLIRSLPVIDLPNDVHQYSYVDLSC